MQSGEKSDVNFVLLSEEDGIYSVIRTREGGSEYDRKKVGRNSLPSFAAHVISKITRPPVTMKPPPKIILSSGICLKNTSEITCDTTKKIAM